MAKPNYGFEKRQRELARKKKQEEKRRRKLEKSAPPAEPGVSEPTPPHTPHDAGADDKPA
jgi:hypothetical protein